MGPQISIGFEDRVVRRLACPQKAAALRSVAGNGSWTEHSTTGQEYPCSSARPSRTRPQQGSPGPSYRPYCLRSYCPLLSRLLLIEIKPKYRKA